MEATIYSTDGKKSGTISLPANIFGVRWNADLVKQVADSMLSSRRKNVAHTKDRSEVSGGGKKPWKQKGTGRARHGSTRSPIWVGGGVTGGPRNEKNFERKVSQKMRTKALYTILSRKMRDGEVLFVKSIVLTDFKTKEAVKTLQSLSSIKGFEDIYKKRKNSAIIALPSKEKKVERAFSNIGNVEMFEARNLDPVSLLGYKYLVIENPEKAFKVLPGVSRKDNE
ncbi:MAG: 50S ribosomal protein L4 [Candidatus Zambryskibacteria bacterium CG11_big_fil_rev_8_21_14_0_20_42_18]|uniref:Large ribosomal subunit protein uL4 n=1 Tax=Candidatus Zambryskibacteria bacterium CG_4_9_14_3_um_filter_42_15 TaxID=1975112 RepID=A0A2M7WS14_9BACT|nr:MAG: 50S ribosomal protein L4 [Candidatus Zambryskibacteria bacterium CG11_big_fil_rev_8_21_14_0_20_42_18]PJA32790.1 MAG: 50S ribosomal protein L4 [Candidatus Zambryskibacteria bacterium CG_4_9_14_3_um_filter_42_15]